MAKPPAISDLIDAMQRIAPLRYAEPWDRVGLLIGRAEAPLDGPVMLTIDLTERVLEEAVAAGARAVIAYHAPIWEPIGRITDQTSRGRIVLGCAEHGIAVYTPHTALDAVPGGVADWLCEGLSREENDETSEPSGGVPRRIEGDCRALTPIWEDAGALCKIVTFVPEADVEKVRSALATAGAGRIGEYELCSFSAPGEGTFRGGPGTSPAIGEPGVFETAPERRLEMVCPLAATPLAIETLRRFHPYEQPAIDVFDLKGSPRRAIGAGRRLVLDRPATMAELRDRMARFLGCGRTKIALPGDDRPITHLGVVPGAGESLLGEAIGEGCEAFITGEMRHHEVIEALHAGLAVMLSGHTNTERGYLPRLVERLSAELPGTSVIPSETDRDPFA